MIMILGLTHYYRKLFAKCFLLILKTPNAGSGEVSF